MGQADRTATVLSRLSKKQEGIEQVLAPGRVAACLGENATTEAQAQLIFSFAVNLLARLYPVVQDLQVILWEGTPLMVRVPRWHADTLDEHIRLFLEALSPPLKWTIQKGVPIAPDCKLIIGSAPMPGERVVFVGSHGWSVALSPHTPVPVGHQLNPVGAYAAACLGVAEVWKRLLLARPDLSPEMPIVPLDEPLTFSTFTYRVGPSEPNPALSSSIDIARLTMVGLGAGGGTAAFTLASLQEVQGMVNLIEPDEVVDTNLNRYVFADSEDAARRRAKTEVVNALFDGRPGIRIRTFSTSYGEAAASLFQDDYRYVVAAVHSREARRELQYETPMVLWDAGATEQGEFFIWRMILGITECMWCKHPPGERDPELEKAAQLEQLLGLGATIWLRKVRNNEIFRADEVDAIAVFLAGKNAPFDLPSVGQRYGDWEAGQCGRLPLPEADEEIPIPFAPVMAGVLLAGEIIKENYFPEATLDSYYWNTLVGCFMRGNQPHRRLPRPECSFCADGIYLSQYRRRWETNPSDLRKFFG